MPGMCPPRWQHAQGLGGRRIGRRRHYEQARPLRDGGPFGWPSRFLVASARRGRVGRSHRTEAAWLRRPQSVRASSDRMQQPLQPRSGPSLILRLRADLAGRVRARARCHCLGEERVAAGRAPPRLISRRPVPSGGGQSLRKPTTPQRARSNPERQLGAGAFTSLLHIAWREQSMYIMSSQRVAFCLDLQLMK